MKRMILIVLMMVFTGFSFERASSGEEVKDGSEPTVVLKVDDQPVAPTLLSKTEAEELIRQENERFWELFRTLETFKLDLAGLTRALEVKRRQHALLKRKVVAGLTALSRSPTNEYEVFPVSYSADAVRRAVDFETDNLIRLDSEIKNLVTSIGSQTVRIDDLQIKFDESERAQIALINRIHALQMENQMADILKRLTDVGNQLATGRDRRLHDYERDLQLSTKQKLKEAGVQPGSRVPLEKLTASNTGDFVQETRARAEAAGIQLGPLGGAVPVSK